MIHNDHVQRSQRQKLIIQTVESGPRSVDDLIALTGASPITIRRDLVELAEQGALRRVRGGAAPLAHRGAPYPFALRQTEHGASKQALAQLAATLVAPGDAVLIDNGTTALSIAQELAGLGVTALALSLHAAAALASKPGNQVIVPGGSVNHDDLSFSGASAVAAIGRMRFDVAFIGSCAAHPETGLTVAGWDDAQIKRAALTASRRAVLVSTPEKFTRTSAHLFGTLDDLDTVITTDAAPPHFLTEAALHDLTLLTIADPEHGHPPHLEEGGTT